MSAKTEVARLKREIEKRDAVIQGLLLALEGWREKYEAHTVGKPRVIIVSDEPLEGSDAET